jgi:hypothetical protein
VYRVPAVESLDVDVGYVVVVITDEVDDGAIVGRVVILELVVEDADCPVPYTSPTAAITRRLAPITPRKPYSVRTHARQA